MATDVAKLYVNTVDLVEPLSRAYGFKTLYVWQPVLYKDGKRLTPFERQLLDASEADEYLHRVRAMNAIVTPILDTAMKRRLSGRFVNEYRLFVGDTSSVFVDNSGHNTEKAIPKIVNGFFPSLSMLVDSLHQQQRSGHRVAESRAPSRNGIGGIDDR